MKTHRLLPLLAALLAAACSRGADRVAEGTPSASPAPELAMATGQSNVKDDDSQKDVVKVAVGSKDHTTLVTALEKADLVNSLSNAGPFTVFAPTNAAFDKLPQGTLDDLLKPENKGKLGDILQHHVTVPALDSTALTDGLVLAMVDGKPATVTRRGADIFVDGAKVIGKVRASNGWVYVVDAVILPKS